MQIAEDRPKPAFSMRCESCVYLSGGFRCQRATSRNYSRKITDTQNTGCPRWEIHWGWSKRRVRDG